MAQQQAPAAVGEHLGDLRRARARLPEYLSSLQSAWLNESATLFRRRYYNNGSHAGFILYVSDAAQRQGDIDATREALKNSKGPGNFRNLFFYSPSGKKDGIQLIPISEVAAKDDFFNIKSVSRDDNERAGEEVVRFKPYQLTEAEGAAGQGGMM